METLLFSLTSGGILILTFLILTNPRKVNLLGNRWLAFLLFTLFFLLIDESLFENKIYEQYPHLLGLDSFFIFATAPALYLSVSHYVSLDKKFKKLDFLHFIPTFLFLPIVILTIFQSAETKLQLIKETNIPAQNDSDIVLYMLWLQIGIYWILAFLKIKKHQKNIKLFASNTSKIDLNWLKYFLFGIGFMVLLWILESLNDTNKVIALLSVSGYFIGTYVLGYFALRQEEIYPFKTVEIEEIKDIIEETPTKQPRISEDDLIILKEKLSNLMFSEKIFLDESLNLPKLADKMQISSHKLSYLLNEGFGENFFQFVNRHRIDEAKRLLISPKYEQLSMIGIAFESGFSSKTTFNTTFKKITGISPSEYIAKKSTETLA
jgi:AraC-like DNA-binding protein